MKITIICVGKIKEKFYREAVEEYRKRLAAYCKLEIIEVQDEKTPERAGENVKEQIKEKEASGILKHIRDDAFVLTLEINGREFDSVSFAWEIEQLAIRGISHIQLIIGGSLGLHRRVSERADLAVSFSKMTFPHQLMRVILLEQLYRSFRIIQKEPYHK